MPPTRDAHDILSIARVASGLLSGPGRKDLECAIRAGDVTDDEVTRLQMLARELQTLVSSATRTHKVAPTFQAPVDSETQCTEDTKLMPAHTLTGVSGAGALTDIFTTASGTPTSPTFLTPSPRSTRYLGKRRYADAGALQLAAAPASSRPSSSLALQGPLLAAAGPSPRPRPTTTFRPLKLAIPPSKAVRTKDGRLTVDSLPDGALLHIFEMVWSGRPSYGENDGRKQLGELALVCRHWRDLAASDELWKPLCIARWPWLKSLKGGPSELIMNLSEYKNTGTGKPPQVWREFCVRQGRAMNRAGIGRRTSWGSEYALGVEIFDRKGGFRLFCSYGRLSVMQQVPSADGRWLSKLAITGFASCWHFSASSRDPVNLRFENIKQYFERCHERGVDNCLCTEVTVMNKANGKMAVVYASSSKEAKRKLTAEKQGVMYFEEELRPSMQTTGTETLSYLAGTGIAVSKVQAPNAAATVEGGEAATDDGVDEKDQKYRIDRLYLVFSTQRRWDINRIFSDLDWS